MSVLHDRIMTQDGEGNRPSVSMLPATPTVMPASEYHYDQSTGDLRYGTLEPWWTGDVNAAPMPVRDHGTWGRVHPAGRP